MNRRDLAKHTNPYDVVASRKAMKKIYHADEDWFEPDYKKYFEQIDASTNKEKENERKIL
jgi:hypothetical protein